MRGYRDTMTMTDIVERLRQRLADAEDDVQRLHNEKMNAIEENIRLRAALENAEQFIDLFLNGISSVDDAKHTLAHIQSALAKAEGR